MADSKVYAALRAHPDCSILNVTLLDGTAREINVPGGRKRPSLASGMVERLPWLRCELLGAKRQLLDVVESGEASETAPAKPIYMTRENELAEILTRFHRSALEGIGLAYGPVLEANTKLLDVVLARLVGMEEKFVAMLDLMHQSAVHLAPQNQAQAAGLEHLVGEFVKAAGPTAATAIAAKFGITLPATALPPAAAPAAPGNGSGSSAV